MTAAGDRSATDPPPRDGPLVVGVDGSPRSVDAFALTDLLAPVLGRDVVIAFVHPYGELSSLLSEGEYETLVRDVADSTFEQVREHLRSVPDRRMRVVSSPSPAAGLSAVAEETSAAMIVIGSSHRSTIGRVLVGGTGERLLAGAPAPVAVAPAGYADARRELRVVGCGFDESEESRRAVLWAAELARRASAKLRVLSVHERTPPALVPVGAGLAPASINEILRRRREAALEQTVAGLGRDLDVDGVLLDGAAGERLAAESADLDVLVVGSRGYGPLRAVLLGSVSSALVRSAQSPLVVIPRGARG